MSRLPNPGSDHGDWGDILNEYLLTEHRADGTHEVAKLLGAPLQSGQLLVSNPAAQSGIAWASLTPDDVGLGNVDNTADSDKPISNAQQTALDAKQPLHATLTSIADSNMLPLASGSLSAPSLSFTADADTGLYRTGVNSVALVGGGTTTPTTLELSTTTAALTLTRSGTAIPSLFAITSSNLSASGGTQAGLRITPTYNQTGTAGSADLLIDRTETSLGSGLHYLIDAQVGGASRFRVSNAGAFQVFPISGDALILDGQGSNNTILRFRDDGTERGAIFTLNGSGNLTVRAQANLVLTSNNATTPRTLTLNGGNLIFDNNLNMIFSTSTGSRIGTAASQKLAFWNATPTTQPTTVGAAAAHTTGGGTTLTSTDTFDGYTIAQVVRALRTTGLLA